MTALNPKADVLVVGAGPTGLVMACELARRGVSYRLIDELPTPATISKAAGVHARTMEMWDAMSFAEEVVPQSRVIRGVNVFSGGKRLVHIPIGEMDSPFPHIYGISQRDIEVLLTQHHAKLGGAIDRGVQLTALSQDAEGVTSTFSHAGGAPEQFRSRWVVGCDGSHSRVRHELGFSFEGAAYEERLIQSDLRVQLPLMGVDDEIVAVLGEGTLMALFPLFKDGRYRMVVLGGKEGENENPTLADFQSALAARIPGATASDPAWVVSFRIHHRHVDAYQDRRVFIAGDACHIHSPVGGQGMNTGMQDAFNLAWKLALASRGTASEHLLESYGPERLPIARDLLGRTDTAMSSMETAMSLHSPLTVGLRNSLLSLVTKLSFVQAKATQTLSMLEQHYKASPLSAQDRGGLWEGTGLGEWGAFGDGPAPGARAPDAPALDAEGKRTTVHRLFRSPRLQLLLFAGPTPSDSLAQLARSAAARAGAELDIHLVVGGEDTAPAPSGPARALRDPSGEIHRRYGTRSECLYLLRPDGYVAYRSNPPDAQKLSAYLDRILARPTARS